MADVAHEEQAAPRQGQLAAVRRCVGPVLVEDAGEGLAVLGDLFGEVALVHAQPVAVSEHLVVGVDGGHGVLEVHDRGDRRLQHDILDAGRVGGADGGVRVDEDLDVQAVVLQQDGPLGRAELAGVADELVGRRQARRQVVAEGDQQLAVVDFQPGRLAPRAGGQRNGAVEEFPRVGDDLVAAHWVIAGVGAGLHLLGAVVLRDHVGAVQRVVQRTPAGVGGVEREPRVEDRHHQLRTRGRGDLVVDTGGGDGEVVRLGLQVADLGEELLVAVGVDRLDDVLAVVLVDLRLQVLAAGEQVLILRAEIGDDLVDARPEAVRVDVGARKRLVVDEVVQHLGDAQVPHRHAVGHFSSLKAVDPAYPAVPGAIRRQPR